MVGVQDAVGPGGGHARREVFAREGGVDEAVDHHVGHVQALRPELARHRLRQRAQRGLASGKGGEAGAAAQAGGGPGEQQRAAPARQHHAGGLATDQEARQRAHLPDLEVLLRRRLQDGEAHVAADVEHHRLHRSHVGLDAVEEGADLLLAPRVQAEGAGTAAVGDDAVHQRLQRRGGAPRDADLVALAREAAGDRRTGGVAGADHAAHAGFLTGVVHGGRLHARAVGRADTAANQRARWVISGGTRSPTALPSTRAHCATMSAIE